MRRVYLTPQLEQDRQCILALISVEAQGREELLWIAYGLRESAQSGREFLLRLRDESCLALNSEYSTRDGALNFWQILRDGRPRTCRQRRWAHRAVNVQHKLSPSMHAKAKEDLHVINESRPTALSALRLQANPIARKAPAHE